MGLFHLTMYGVGLILGAGIYVLIGEAAGLAGNSMWVSFGLGAVVAALAGLSYSELVALFPRAAAEYVFVKNAFKSRFVGFVIGWLTAITSMVVGATVALGFGGYLAEFLGVPVVVSAVLLLGALSLVNFVGIRYSAWMNTVLAIITIAGLALIIILGALAEPAGPIDYLESPGGITGVVLAFVLIFFAYIGFEDMANVAEEVRRPRKTLPRAIFLSVIISAAIYILVAVSSVRVLNWQELAGSAAPLADVAARGLGPAGGATLGAIVLFATASTVLITLVAGARILYGMARNGSLPQVLGRVHAGTGTPWVAVIGIFATSAGFALVGDIVIVANIVVFAVVITFAMVNLSVILLRYTMPDVERPYRVPLNVGKFPVLPLLGFGVTAYMATQFEAGIIGAGAAIVAAGVAFYLVYRRVSKG